MQLLLTCSVSQLIDRHNFILTITVIDNLKYKHCRKVYLVLLWGNPENMSTSSKCRIRFDSQKSKVLLNHSTNTYWIMFFKLYFQVQILIFETTVVGNRFSIATQPIRIARWRRILFAVSILRSKNLINWVINRKCKN